jgi:hypothetical protein
MLRADCSVFGLSHHYFGLSAHLLGKPSIHGRSGAVIQLSEKMDLIPSKEEQNPYAKFVDRDNATPPTWREEAQCVISARMQSPAELFFWMFGPPTMMLLVGASLIWVVRGFWA